MYGANDCYCRTKNTSQNWTVSKTVKNYAYLAADGLGGVWVKVAYRGMKKRKTEVVYCK